MAFIPGTNGPDTLSGTEDVDTNLGYGEDDTLYGAGGADSLFGGSDADSLYGGSDADSLFGGHDDDMLFGGSGATGPTRSAMAWPLLVERASNSTTMWPCLTWAPATIAPSRETASSAARRSRPSLGAALPGRLASSWPR